MMRLPQTMLRNRPRTPAGALALLRSRSGAAALEFALVALPFLSFIFCIIEFSRVIWTQSAMHYAVEAAARCAVVDTKCSTQAEVQGYAHSQMFAPNVPPSSFELSSCFNNGGKKVTATVRFAFLMGELMPAPPLTLTAESCRSL